MTPVDLSIIIVNWNSKEYVRKCVASILANTVGVNHEIIVVDSGSFDGCGDLLSLAYPKVRFIQSQDNVGFARANNLGAAQAQGAFLLFLNPDTEVRPGAIEHVFRYAAALTDLGVVGCRLLNTDGSLQTSCVQSLPTILNQVLDADVLRRWFPSARLFGTAALFVPGPSPREVEAISGAFIMIRRHVFERLGGFSVEYFMYGEDLDLCLKARCHGFRNYYIAEAIVIHHGGGSTQRTLSKFSTVMMLESVHRLLRKSRGPRYGASYRMALSGAASIRLVLLGLLSPAWFAAGAANAWTAACRKWYFVLRWGLTLERWTKHYGQPNPAPARSKGPVETSCAGSAEN